VTGYLSPEFLQVVHRSRLVRMQDTGHAIYG
jgi:hypothetical protein